MKDMALTYRKTALWGLLACALAALLACGAQVMAASPAYAEETGSITITFIGSDTHGPIVGMESRAYKVASFTDASSAEMMLDPGYIDLANILGWQNGKAAAEQDASWWQRNAKTLDCYVRHGTYEPTLVSATNEHGTVAFTNLSDGLYLVLNTGDGIHRFNSSLVTIGGNKEFEQVVEPKNITPDAPYDRIKVVKHWMGDTAADRPASVHVQLMRGDERYGDPVELSDANGWTYTWTNLDASKVYYWDVVELDPVDHYMISLDENNGTFTITNERLPFPPFSYSSEMAISKQAVGGGAELPGATLQIVDSSNEIIEEFVSGTAPTHFSLEPGEYTLVEKSAPDGYELAEDMTFRVNEDETVDCMQNGEWVNANGIVVMYDALSGSENEEVGTPPTNNPPVTSITQQATPSRATQTTPAAQAAVQTARLPQTGQLWWPVPVLLIAGIVAIGIGRIIAFRSR